MEDNIKPKRIHLIGDDSRHEEGKAAVAITPGQLIMLDSAGTYRPHGTANGAAETLFALEDALQGKTIDDDYAADDQIGFVVAEPGDVIYALLDPGENVAIGAHLSSAGNGNLQAATSTNIRRAIALEAVDNTDSDAVAARIRVRVV